VVVYEQHAGACVEVNSVNTDRCTSTAADVHNGPVLRKWQVWLIPLVNKRVSSR